MTASSTEERLGISLGSGAARGLAHIGVLKVLEEAAIPVKIVTGTSMGAFIGALFAAGVPVSQMEKAALEVDWRSLTRLLDPILPTSGLTDGRKLMAFMADLLPARDFKDLNIPLGVTATDIHTGEAVIIRQGDLLEALRASLAFPGIFAPVRFGKRFLVDGGLCNPIPTDVARLMGASKVIGVCTIPTVVKRTPETFLPTRVNGRRPLSSWRDFTNPRRLEQAFRAALGQDSAEIEQVDAADTRAPNIFKVCAQSVAIMENVINELRLKQTPEDLIIRPDLADVTLLEFHRAAEIIAAGETAARLALASTTNIPGSA